MNKIKTRLFKHFYRNQTIGELISVLLTDMENELPQHPIFVETGSGISTVSLARLGGRFNAKVHSCDFNPPKLGYLLENVGSVDNVQFHEGDSLSSLTELCSQLDQVDFLFLDSAASALHTFQEFKIAEPLLKPGSCVLIDNAAHPKQRLRLGPCRKGKILVPYLLASADWEVSFYPRTADSMVAAYRRSEGYYADGEYEHPDYVDEWEKHFFQQLTVLGS